MFLRMQTVIWTALLLGCVQTKSTGVNRTLNDVEDSSTVLPRRNEFLSKMLSYVFNVLDLKEVVSEAKLGRVGGTSCMTCKFGVSMVQDFVESGKSEDDIAQTIISVCKTLKLFSDRVCEGTVHNFKAQALHVLSHVTLSSDEICGLLLGPNCASTFNPLHNWTIPMPDVPKPPVQPVNPPKAGSPVLKVLQITDLHYDPMYLENSNAVCGDPLCCREGDGTPVKPEDRAGPWGDYRSCDTPYGTLTNMLQHIAKEHHVDYVMMTGDIAAHDIWNVTREEVLHLIKVTSAMVKSYFPDTLVFPSIGNHEGVPVNSFPPPDSGPQFNMQWLYNDLVNIWGQWLPKEAEVTLKNGGYYSVKVRKGLRIIAVNSNFCNSFNFWLLLNSTDPSQQLQWLTDELLKAEQNDEKVHIISHIPPGKFDCMRVWSENYNKIINRFESTVRGQFYGHTHQDDFEIFYEPDGRATNIAYISPSVTTYGGVNPAFRIYTVDGGYDGSSFAVLNHESYFLNLTNANVNGKVEWNKAYSAKEEYQLESLQPDQWDKLVYKMEKDDQIFQTFSRHYYMESDFTRDPCTDNCKAEMICALRTARSNDITWCGRF